MRSQIDDFESGLHRARAIMSIAHRAHQRSDLTKPTSEVVKGMGAVWGGVNGKVISTVNRVVSTHPDLDAKGLQHFFGGDKHLGFGGPTSDVKATIRPKGATRGNLHVFANGKKVTVQQYTIGSTDQIATRGQAPATGQAIGNQIFEQTFVRGRICVAQLVGDKTSGGPIRSEPGNVGDHLSNQFAQFESNLVRVSQCVHSFIGNDFTDVPRGHAPAGQRGVQEGVSKQFEHGHKLADHDPQYEVACPHCQQRFLDNGWTGYTPIYQNGYGQRTWQCPTCGQDMKAVTNRPMRSGKFADASGDLSQRLSDYYHLAPTEERDRIRSWGLQPSWPGASERWGEGGDNEAWDQPTGVYVYDQPFGTQDYTGEHMDRWRIPESEVREKQEEQWSRPTRDEGMRRYVIPHSIENPLLDQPYEDSPDAQKQYRDPNTEWKYQPGAYQNRPEAHPEWGIGFPDRVVGKFADLNKQSGGLNWDPTTCEDCGGAMSEPQMIPGGGWGGPTWINHCTRCHRSREVLPQNPLLQSMQQNAPDYPETLRQVAPDRPWVFS